MLQTISILLENKPGALLRVTGVLSARGYNIEGLTVAKTLDPELSRMTITVGRKQIPVRLIAERHILEDLGWLPTPADYIGGMPIKPWMSGKQTKTVPLATLNLTGEAS